MARNYLTNPSPSQYLGIMLEDLGIADIAEKEAGHVPFAQAMNGFGLGFPVPDTWVWIALLASMVYSAMQMRLI